VTLWDDEEAASGVVSLCDIPRDLEGARARLKPRHLQDLAVVQGRCRIGHESQAYQDQARTE
jgi:hypothetical protein